MTRRTLFSSLLAIPMAMLHPSTPTPPVPLPKCFAPDKLGRDDWNRLVERVNSLTPKE